MGCCNSTDSHTAEVNRELLKDKKSDQNVRKLLFLGSGGSGKSTLFKQLRTIHGEGFSAMDIAGYRDHIYSQVITQMQDMIFALEDLRNEEPDEFGELELSEEGMELARKMDDLRSDQDVDSEVAAMITALWNEPSLKAVYKERGRLRLHDSSAYFWDKVDEIAKADYKPSHDDILMVRHRTTGVVEQEFEVEGVMFKVVDVGGQKNERKKWINCFEHVTAVIFVSALSCYSEMLFEDETVNSMDDSLDLFKEICNLRWFEKTAMILFLNKKDLFGLRLQTVPITKWDSNFDGDNPHDYDACVAYIKARFEGQNENPSKTIITHTTMATDKNNVERVFAAVQHIVINYALDAAGVV